MIGITKLQDVPLPKPITSTATPHWFTKPHPILDVSRGSNPFLSFSMVYRTLAHPAPSTALPISARPPIPSLLHSTPYPELNPIISLQSLAHRPTQCLAAHLPPTQLLRRSRSARSARSLTNRQSNTATPTKMSEIHHSTTLSVDFQMSK